MESKREIYLGIDIGTTNSKCLMLDENANIVGVFHHETPKKQIEGKVFFDLNKIEKLVDGFVSSAGEEFDVKSIGFSSVGESIVPIKDGKAIMDPPMWNDYLMRGSDEQEEVVKHFASSDTKDNGLFSIHKILWMRNTFEDVKNADMFLPLSSYLVFRKTGIAAWDYSQACRTNMFDSSSLSWNRELLAAMDIKMDCDILPMGSNVGTSCGVTYGLGGHDHQVGFFGIRRIFNKTGLPVVYNSMGTSCVISLERDAWCLLEGYVLPSENGKRIVTRSFRSFGGFLKKVRDKLGLEEDFQTISQKAFAINDDDISTLFLADGDWIVGSRGKDSLEIIPIKENADSYDVMRSAYIYLASITRLMEKEMLDEEHVFVSGGGITADDAFMSCLATAEEAPVYIVETSEISSLGAALVGLCAYSGSDECARIASSIRYRKVYPDKRLEKAMSKAFSYYLDLKKKYL